MTRSQSLGPAYDPFREFARRRLAELLGLATLAACAALTLALFTWSARDPSFNQATDARVHNLLGLPGAVVADLFMQTIGVATSAALLPIAALGLRLLSHRGVERARLRAVLWFIGVVCAAAAASLLPVTDRWPLPTGLGGVVGDAVLSLPRHVTGGNRLVLALIGVVAIVGAILSLTAAAGYGLESEADMREEARRQALGQRALQHDEDDEDAAGEPGVALVSLGALLHFLLTVQASFRRGFARLGASLRRPAATDFEPRPIGPAERREPIFDDLDDYDSPPPPRRPAASIAERAVPRHRRRAGASFARPLRPPPQGKPIASARRRREAAAIRPEFTSFPIWRCSPSRRSRPGRPRFRRTRWIRTPAFSKACWTIFRCAARSSTCVPARS